MLLLLYACNTEVCVLLLPYHGKAMTCILCHILLLLLLWPTISNLFFNLYIHNAEFFFCFAVMVEIFVLYCYVVRVVFIVPHPTLKLAAYFFLI
jgi:hypothetical protein